MIGVNSTLYNPWCVDCDACYLTIINFIVNAGEGMHDPLKRTQAIHPKLSEVVNWAILRLHHPEDDPMDGLDEH